MTRPRWSGVTVLALAALAGTAFARQSVPPTDALTKLRTYLQDYEAQLGTLVADEQLTQWRVQTYGVRQGAETVARYRRQPGRAHVLVSEVAFLPLPADAGWLGYRDVRRVNGRAVRRADAPLGELLRAASNDARARASMLLADSARHNAGAPRTINLPSLPLELLHGRNATRFNAVVRDRRETMNGCDAVRIEFSELFSPTIIQRHGGGDLRSQVTAWVEPATGRLCRADVVARDASRQDAFEAMVSVDFIWHAALAMLVPSTMREQFVFPPRGRGEGEATYSNYRRFTTSGRLLPPG